MNIGSKPNASKEYLTEKAQPSSILRSNLLKISHLNILHLLRIKCIIRVNLLQPPGRRLTNVVTTKGLRFPIILLHYILGYRQILVLLLSHISADRKGEVHESRLVGGVVAAAMINIR